jgi:hypothetical protein
MSREREAAEGSVLKRLTAKEIDWSLYTGEDEYEIEEPSFITEFWSESYDLIRGSYGKVNAFDFVEVRKSEELERFLAGNRPGTIFFDPSEIASLLTPNSSMVSKHRKTKTFEQFVFSLNPRVQNFSKEDLQYEMTFTRPLVDVDNMKSEHPEPFLIVEFPSKYDGDHVVFCPEIRMTYGDLWSHPSGKLQEEMLAFLRIEEKKVEQKLDFSLNKGKRNLLDGYSYSVEVDIAKSFG